MENFVCVYNFRDKEIQNRFEEKLLNNYPNGRKEKLNELPVYGFSTRELAEVEENLGNIIYGLNAGDPDVVAIYYDRDADEEKIKRSLICGQENRFDSLVEDIRSRDYNDMITEMLDNGK